MIDCVLFMTVLEISLCSRVYLEHVVSCLDAIGRVFSPLCLLVLLEHTDSLHMQMLRAIETCHFLNIKLWLIQFLGWNPPSGTSKSSMWCVCVMKVLGGERSLVGYSSPSCKVGHK